MNTRILALTLLIIVLPAISQASDLTLITSLKSMIGAYNNWVVTEDTNSGILIYAFNSKGEVVSCKYYSINEKNCGRIKEMLKRKDLSGANRFLLRRCEDFLANTEQAQRHESLLPQELQSGSQEVISGYRNATTQNIIKALKDTTPESLLEFSESGDVEAIKKIINKFPEAIDSKNADGRSAIHIAAKGGKTAALTFLLEKSRDPFSVDKFGNTPLHLAAMGGVIDCIKLLVSKGATIDAKNENGRTALSLALENEHRDIANFLITCGASKENASFANLKVADWLLLNKNGPDRVSNESAKITKKAFLLTNGEKILGQVIAFGSGSYKILTSHGQVEIKDTEIKSMNSEDSLSVASEKNLGMFHKQASDVLLRLCSQCDSGINLVSGIQIFSSASGDLDAVLRKYKEFPVIGKFYQQCFEILKMPLTLHGNSISRNASDEGLIFLFKTLLESKDWVSETNRNEFPKFLPRLYSQSWSSSMNIWYTSNTGEALAFVSNGIRKEMEEISKILEE